MAVAPRADGVVTKEELSGKVEGVLVDNGIRERVGALRDAASATVGRRMTTSRSLWSS